MDEFKKAIDAIAQEVEAKKMVPMPLIVKMLEDYSPYCNNCEADDDMYLDCSGEKPVIRCMWCQSSITIEDLAKAARALPGDYLDRMIQAPPTPFNRISVEQVGADTWVSDGFVAEMAGNPKTSYPDRNDFRVITGCIGKIVGNMDGYERARVSRKLFRPKNGDRLLAVLESKTHTVYINSDYVAHIGGIFAPYIHGALDPVLIKAGETVRRLIMPVRVAPKELEDDPL